MNKEQFQSSWSLVLCWLADFFAFLFGIIYFFLYYFIII